MAAGSHTSRSNFPSPNSPNRLVSNDNILPSLLINRLVDRFQLFHHHIHSNTLFSLLETLSTAQYDCNAVFDGALGLAGNEVVIFLENTSTLAMPDQCPFDAGVFELGG